ncbi:hypothetical protein ROZALSC1DRAFT_24011 [Rozella allomycis CSF55]|uniref:Uncharacterized protein n=1 Tax=Rozella allomycis (strain CSF55) TaxID=988480 RepID=A0A4P9YDU7_ROZAC|nr:hypothetical protein ROZALSC1DRAFT_24011 [Rozella allomycis CSF55]
MGPTKRRTVHEGNSVAPKPMHLCPLFGSMQTLELLRLWYLILPDYNRMPLLLILSEFIYATEIGKLQSSTFDLNRVLYSSDISENLLSIRIYKDGQSRVSSRQGRIRTSEKRFSNIVNLDNQEKDSLLNLQNQEQPIMNIRKQSTSRIISIFLSQKSVKFYEWFIKVPFQDISKNKRKILDGVKWFNNAMIGDACITQLDSWTLRQLGLKGRAIKNAN